MWTEDPLHVLRTMPEYPDASCGCRGGVGQREMNAQPERIMPSSKFGTWISYSPPPTSPRQCRHGS